MSSVRHSSKRIIAIVRPARFDDALRPGLFEVEAPGWPSFISQRPIRDAALRYRHKGTPDDVELEFRHCPKCWPFLSGTVGSIALGSLAGDGGVNAPALAEPRPYVRRRPTRDGLPPAPLEPPTPPETSVPRRPHPHRKPSPSPPPGAA